MIPASKGRNNQSIQQLSALEAPRRIESFEHPRVLKQPAIIHPHLSNCQVHVTNIFRRGYGRAFTTANATTSGSRRSVQNLVISLNVESQNTYDMSRLRVGRRGAKEQRRTPQEGIRNLPSNRLFRKSSGWWAAGCCGSGGGGGGWSFVGW